ncbi:hypothetical protein [Mesobacillus harenae]|uniref:hypothetical protein n=1 Tax=Mesobacillus harenae TaxID=2213203 RepID=UPI00157FD47E|nr:hypothetical protein [Mesobacillus harenae]
MTVNHGGSLSKQYFISYIKLVQNSRNSSIETAKQITMDLFFRMDKSRYGQETYKSFLAAYHELKKES